MKLTPRASLYVSLFCAVKNNEVAEQLIWEVYWWDRQIDRWIDSCYQTSPPVNKKAIAKLRSRCIDAAAATVVIIVDFSHDATAATASLTFFSEEGNEAALHRSSGKKEIIYNYRRSSA